jgi:hypothetical protein
MQATTQWLTSFQNAYTPQPWLQQATYEDLCKQLYLGNANAPAMNEPVERWENATGAMAAAAATGALAGLTTPISVADAFQNAAPAPEATLRLRAPL